MQTVNHRWRFGSSIFLDYDTFRSRTSSYRLLCLISNIKIWPSSSFWLCVRNKMEQHETFWLVSIISAPFIVYFIIFIYFFITYQGLPSKGKKTELRGLFYCRSTRRSFRHRLCREMKRPPAKRETLPSASYFPGWHDASQNLTTPRLRKGSQDCVWPVHQVANEMDSSVSRANEDGSTWRLSLASLPILILLCTQKESSADTPWRECREEQRRSMLLLWCCSACTQRNGSV